MTDPVPSLATPYRSHTCGELRVTDAGTNARLAGWVHRRRDHGQLIFLDLRDRHGITQVVIDAAAAAGALGWKVNGAGGDGGTVTIVCGDRRPEVDEARVLPLRLSRQGVRITG